MTYQLPPPPDGCSSHPVDIGDRTEAIIVAELMRRGHRILRPLSTNLRYDLVLDLGDRFLRVQCKTGRLRNGAILFSVRSCRSDTKRTYVRSYSAEEADVFLIHCPGRTASMLSRSATPGPSARQACASTRRRTTS